MIYLTFFPTLNKFTLHFYLNKFNLNHKFTYEKSKEKINFVDVVVKIKEGRIINDLYCKYTDGRQYFHYDSCHADHIKRSICLVRHSDEKEYVLKRMTLMCTLKTLKYGFVKRDNLTILSRNMLKRPLNSLRVMNVIVKK